MLVSDFDFELPEELIAHYPPPNRGDSRVLQVGANALPPFVESQFVDLKKNFRKGDVLVMNNTKVMKARLFGEKSTGGRVEILIERVLGTFEVLAHVRASKSPKVSSILSLGDVSAQVIGRDQSLFHLKFSQSVFECMDKLGHMPLPPYLARADEAEDESRYQTVFAQHLGAVAAPTAGLHLNEAFLHELENIGVELVFVTLHVGAGTFQPVRVEHLHDHVMHSEQFEIGEAAALAIARAKSEGRRVIAVGTTSLRALEAAAQRAALPSLNMNTLCAPFEFFEQFDRAKFIGAQETDIFIYGHFNFKIVDILITNFHLPRSTLLMLVSAFAGQARIRAAYQQAIRSKFRFYSYGDAMWLERGQ